MIAVGETDGLHEQPADAIRDAASHHATIGDDRMTIYLARDTALSVGEANALTAYCDLADALGGRFEAT